MNRRKKAKCSAGGGHFDRQVDAPKVLETSQTNPVSRSTYLKGECTNVQKNKNRNSNMLLKKRNSQRTPITEEGDVPEQYRVKPVIYKQGLKGIKNSPDRELTCQGKESCAGGNAT